MKGDKTKDAGAGKTSDSADPEGARMERGGLDGGGGKDAAKSVESGTQLLSGGGGPGGGNAGTNPGPNFSGFEHIEEMKRKQEEISAKNEAIERENRAAYARMRKG